MPPSWLERQKVEVAKRVAQADIVITTALIPGRPAPVLVTEEWSSSMKPGSVIVDLAAPQGGNCPLTEAGRTVIKHGVTIVGETNLPALVAADASALYARNVLDFLKLVVNKDGGFHVPMDDDIVAACLMTRDGEVEEPESGPPPKRLESTESVAWTSCPPTVTNLIIFVLAIYVGYHVVWTVTPALHTPLMSVTNAISAIIVVGAMLAAALTEGVLGKSMGVLAVALAAVNIFGGFLVTRRMLEMFKKKAPAASKTRAAGGQASHEHERRHAAVPGRQRLLHPGAQGPVASDHVDPRQHLRHDRHGDRGRHDRGADLEDRIAAATTPPPASAGCCSACWPAGPTAPGAPRRSR